MKNIKSRDELFERMSAEQIEKAKHDWLGSQDTAKYRNGYKFVPKILYHGTTPDLRKDILKNGLDKGMLTPNWDTAEFFGASVLKITGFDPEDVAYLGHDCSFMSATMQPVYLVVNKILPKFLTVSE